MSEDKKKSYRNTAVIAITSIVNIFFSIVKNKFLAIFIGPKGMGTFGILNDTVNFASSLASLGLSNSGVQAISEARTESVKEIKETYNGLLRIFTWVAIVAMTTFMGFSGIISNYLIGNDSLMWPFIIVSFGILFRLITNVQNALIIGMQKIKLLAKSNIYNGAIVAIFSIIMAYIWGMKSIPFLVLSIPIVSWTISYTQTRKVLRDLPKLKSKKQIRELKPFLLLGIMTLYASLLENVVNLVTKSSILKGFGADYLGYYQVAIGITVMYVGFITGSISNDYYPRLIEKVKESVKATNEFVNNQISISMHLIMPILLIFLAYATFFIQLLYSEDFLPAAELISYSIAGTLLRVISWPLVYVFLAHKDKKIYFISELIGNSSHLVLILLAIYWESFEWLGIAYILHYIIYIIFAITVFIIRFKGEIQKQNVLFFLLNVAVIIVLILGKVFIDGYEYLIAPLLILFMFYIGRKEYKFIIQSLTSKVFKTR